MNEMNALLTQLESITNIPLNESDEFGVSKSFEVLQKALFGSAVSKYIIDDKTYEMIKKCRKIYITPDYAIVTYSTIYNNIPYKFDSANIMKYVFTKINTSATKDSKFDPTETVHEAISLAFKELTNIDKKRLSIDEFRYQYNKLVYGSRIQLIPNVQKLADLTMNSSFKMNYVSAQGIRKHIRSISNYSRETIDNFNRIEKNNPELSDKLNSYKKAIVDTISAIVQIYKIILRALDSFLFEYKRIFKEIIRINERLSTQNENVYMISQLIDYENNVLCESADDQNNPIINYNDKYNKKLEYMLKNCPKNRQKNLESLNKNMHYIYNFNYNDNNDIGIIKNYHCPENVVKPLKHINIDKLFGVFDNINNYSDKSEEYVIKNMLYNLECENIADINDKTIFGKLEKYITGEPYYQPFNSVDNISVDTISTNCITALNMMERINEFLNNKSTDLKQLSNKKNVLIYYMIFECIFSSLFKVISESQLLCKIFSEKLNSF